MSENAILGHCHRSLFFSIAISVTQARLAMPCIASSFRSAHKPRGSCNATKSREWLNLIYKIRRRPELPDRQCLFLACAVQRRRFPVGASPTRQPLQPEAIGAVMEVTKWLKPSISVSRIGDSASVQAATRVNAKQASKRTMCRPTRLPYRGRLKWLGELSEEYAPLLHRGIGGAYSSLNSPSHFSLPRYGS